MFKKSYVVSAESWNDMLKKKKPSPPALHHHIEPLASGLTATSRLNRFRKKRSSKKTQQLPPPSAGRIDSYFLPEDTRDILSQLPLEIRQQAMALLNFVSKKIPPSMFTWDRTTLELIFRHDVLPESNFAEVIKYLFGVGNAWLTSYTKPEIGVSLGAIRSIPRGASHFYFTLERYQETPTTVFGFHPPLVLNLARFHFSVLESTMSPDEKKQTIKTFADNLQKETTRLDLQKFYQHSLWSHPTKTAIGSLPARYPRNLDILPKSKPATTVDSPSSSVLSSPPPLDVKIVHMEPSPQAAKQTISKIRKTKSERNAAKAARDFKIQKITQAREKKKKKRVDFFRVNSPPPGTKKSWNDELGGNIIASGKKRDRRPPERFSPGVAKRLEL